jgi:hypothetical protein
MWGSEEESDEGSRKSDHPTIAGESPERVIFPGTEQDHPFE